MAIGVLRDLPGITSDVYDAVVREIDIVTEPAAGILFHTAGPLEDGTWREFFICESREAWEIFLNDRILPAAARVMGEQALNSAPPPESQYMDVHAVINLLEPSSIG